MESQFPNTVPVGVRFPNRNLWRHATKRSQSCSSSMPQPGSRRRLQVPQHFFKSSVVHNLILVRFVNLVPTLCVANADKDAPASSDNGIHGRS